MFHDPVLGNLADQHRILVVHHWALNMDLPSQNRRYLDPSLKDLTFVLLMMKAISARFAASERDMKH